MREELGDREGDGKNSRQTGNRGGYGLTNTDNTRFVTVEFVLLSVYPEREVRKQGWYSEIDQLCLQ